MKSFYRNTFILLTLFVIYSTVTGAPEGRVRKHEKELLRYILSTFETIETTNDIVEASKRNKRQIWDDNQIYGNEKHVCPTEKIWVAVDELAVTVDTHGNDVKIVQPPNEPKQYIYIHQCKPEFECKKCKGVSFKSQCVMQHTFMKLHHVYAGYDTGEPVFDYVEVPSHCACHLLLEHHHKEPCNPKHHQFK